VKLMDEQKKFELRGLKSCDMFPMFGILSKIGFKDLKNSLTPESIQDMMDAFKESEGDGKDKDKDSNGAKTTFVGFSIVMDVVEIIMKNLPRCEKEIYSFLANLSGMTVEEIADLDMVTFTEMIIAVVQKDEFKDFFKVVSRLFN